MNIFTNSYNKVYTRTKKTIAGHPRIRLATRRQVWQTTQLRGVFKKFCKYM